MILLAGSLVAGLALPALAAEKPTALAKFVCTDGKWIEAAFFPDKVDLKLSDGRVMSLPQAMSGSGARYANADETEVFWNTGNTGTLTEKNVDTYANCTAK